MTRHVLISSVKDEGPFLLEWVAHHLVLGFDRICIATNDCRDGTDQLAAALDRAGYIRHVPNVLQPGEIPQHAGYDRIRMVEPIDQADWLMVLDADEFLNIHVGNHRIGALTALAEAEIDVIALNAMCFTDAPEVNWQPGRICPRFVGRLRPKHKANSALKCLTRHPARFRGIHNHHMVGFRDAAPLHVMSGGGQRSIVAKGTPLVQALRASPREDITHRLAQYNHYCIKTWDSFMLRRDRGRGAVAETNAENLRHTEDYFAERSMTAGQDTTIARYDTEVAALMAEMLTSAEIHAAQTTCDQLYATFATPYRR